MFVVQATTTPLPWRVSDGRGWRETMVGVAARGREQSLVQSLGGLFLATLPRPLAAVGSAGTASASASSGCGQPREGRRLMREREGEYA